MFSSKKLFITVYIMIMDWKVLFNHHFTITRTRWYQKQQLYRFSIYTSIMDSMMCNLTTLLITFLIQFLIYYSFNISVYVNILRAFQHDRNLGHLLHRFHSFGKWGFKQILTLLNFVIINRILDIQVNIYLVY